MQINIQGLNKAKLLLSLYNAACCQGDYFKDKPYLRRLVTMQPGNLLIAEDLIATRHRMHKYHFGAINLGSGPRPLAISLGTNILDSTKYDHYHGRNRAWSAIQQLRKASPLYFSDPPFNYEQSYFTATEIKPKKPSPNGASK